MCVKQIRSPKSANLVVNVAKTYSSTELFVTEHLWQLERNRYQSVEQFARVCHQFLRPGPNPVEFSKTATCANE